VPRERPPSGSGVLSSRETVLEVQFHPKAGAGRRRVLRLSRRGFRLALAALSAYVLLIAGGLAVAPASIGSLLRREEYGVQVSRRVQLGGRLQSLVGRLEELSAEGKGLASRLRKIRAAYEVGEGGAPRALPPAADPAAAGAATDSIFGATAAHGLRLEAELGFELEAIEEELARIVAFEREHPQRSRTTPARNPLAGEEFVQTSGFGRRRSPYTQQLEFHAGLDLAAPVGTPIAAAADGVVTFAGTVEASRRSDWWRLGRVVAIRHGDGFVTLYGHCEKLLVRDGQRVRGGERIATVGDSGWSMGPHLHYEVRRQVGRDRFEPMDPGSYFLDSPEAAGESEEGAALPRERPPEAAMPLLSTFLR